MRRFLKKTHFPWSTTKWEQEFKTQEVTFLNLVYESALWQLNQPKGIVINWYRIEKDSMERLYTVKEGKIYSHVYKRYIP